MSLWDVVPQITTPIALGAFVTACVAWLIRSWMRTRLAAMKQDLDAVSAAPAKERGPLLEVVLGRYHVPVNDAPPHDRMRVHMELLRQRAERFRIIAFVLVLLAVLGLITYAVYRGDRGQARRPTVVLMDSPLPDVVYSAERRKTGGTNADDLTDFLKDLPILLVKETTSLAWNREDEVLGMHPNLIVMHLSAFYEHSHEDDAHQKLHTFLLYMTSKGIPFVIYTRPPLPPMPADLEARWQAIQATIHDPAIKPPVAFVPIEDSDEPWKDLRNRSRIREAVLGMLAIDAKGS